MPDNAKSPPEPSMEEIIASISRIFPEDKALSEPMRPGAEKSAEKNDILELTEALNEDGSVRHIAGPGESKNLGSTPAAREEAPIANATAWVEPGTSHRETAIEPKLGVGRERIVSAATSGAAAAAFAQLGALSREKRRDGELGLGRADRTLEDIVRDVVRPFLETWLNEHLPGIVERLVREEIARVISEAGLR
jgi:cell pole-organizing protein PopZ